MMSPELRYRSDSVGELDWPADGAGSIRAREHSMRD
jgi:hypothetical protein